MQARTHLGSALLAAGLLLAGCGGGAPVDEEQDALVSREDEAPNCEGLSYETNYYSDATYTTLVGSRGCDCGYFFYWGKTSSFRQHYDYGGCF